MINRRRAHLSLNPIIRGTNERAMCYLPLHKKKKKTASFHRYFVTIHDPKIESKIRRKYRSGRTRGRHLHPSASIGIVDWPLSTGTMHRGDAWVVTFHPPVEWKSAGHFFPLQQEGKVRVEEKSGGLLTSFDESVFFVGTRRLSIRFLFTFCHGAPLFSLLCPFSASLLE